MSTAHSQPVRPSVVPPLQPGDRLTRAEFERRYDATPGLKKAELIEGIVYVPPPVSQSWHSNPHSHLINWLGHYEASTPGVQSGNGGSLRLDLDNMPQPDAFLMIDPNRGGQARIDSDGYVAGAPELIGEIAASTVSYDLHVKLNVYRRNGVREYVVWRTYDREIDYMVLREGQYQKLSFAADGVIRSEVFPGLWLAPGALLAGDLASVLRVVQDGLASPEHREFVQRLSQEAP
jgi:Uma2 family endonuclease